MLATRHDVRLGLHRLRLEGELAEIRADDLRFTVDEARALFAAAGVELAGPALGMLEERTEGWAAGLRLAALSLAGHPDPERFAAEFSGSERTVAEYLLAEVLERQPEEVRRLLLRTSVLERVNGELADLLTGGSGGERMLQDLEEANAFVVSLDAARSWFRYHHLFADLLQLELRRTEPAEVTALHELAAGWLAGHGYPVEAIRHAQAARDWGLAARLLADHWPGLHLGGQEATVHALMAGFPAGAPEADAELAAVAAADELALGSLEAAERYLGLAEREVGVGAGRAARAGARCCSGWSGCSWPGGAATSRRGPSRRSGCWRRPRPRTAGAWPGWARSCARWRWSSIGNAETWAGPLDQAESHLEQGLALARRIGRPYLEFMAWRTGRQIELMRRLPRAEELQQAGDRPGRAARLDRRSVRRLRLHDAGIRAGLAGAAGRGGALGAARRAYPSGGSQPRGGDGESATSAASSSWGGAGSPPRWPRSRPLERLAGPHPLGRPLRAWLLHAMVRPGDTRAAEQILAGLHRTGPRPRGDPHRHRGAAAGPG